MALLHQVLHIGQTDDGCMEGRSLRRYGPFVGPAKFLFTLPFKGERPLQPGMENNGVAFMTQRLEAFHKRVGLCFILFQ